MKQNISKQDLEQLSDYQIEKLFDYWWDDESEPRNGRTPSEYIEYGTGTKYALPLMSIGDMIEFLENENEFEMKKWNNWMVYCNKTSEMHRDELCDALWCAVSYILKL